MIRSERQSSGVHLLVLDRHERRNALDVEHLDKIRLEVREAVDDGARVLVVTGVGSVFSAGADLDQAYAAEFRDALYAALAAIVEAPVPVIAAVNGPAIGAGAQLALACDLRVGGEHATFSVPTARNGLAVDGWTVRRLALLTSGSMARNLLLGAATLSSEDAHGFGLLGRRGDLEVAISWAEDIASMAPLSLAYSKRALADLMEREKPAAATHEMFDACWNSIDVQEARRARTERRTPIFQGK